MKRAEEKVILAILASAALVSSVMMLIVYKLIKKNFIRPIGLLTKSAKAMVATKILIKYGMKQGLSPAEAFRTSNEKLIESNEMDLFVTAWLVQIDLDTGECIEVNAGHEHPAVRKAGGVYELIKYKHSPALATLEEIIYKERSLSLEPGDSIFVYTDGVTEATNFDKKLFGKQ